MKKLLLALLLLASVLALSGPAWAQADPFEPKEGQAESATGGSDEGSEPFEPADPQAGTTSGDSNEVEPVTPGTDALPVTGADTEMWLVAAYGLVTTGVGLLVLHRVHRPQPVR